MIHNGTLSRIRQRRSGSVVSSTTPAKPKAERATESAACVAERSGAIKNEKHQRSGQTAPRGALYNDELLRPVQAAMLLNVTPRCLQDWRLKGAGPRFIRMSPKLVQYRRSDLEKFIEESAA
jgi:hypothetical protein